MPRPRTPRVRTAPLSILIPASLTTFAAAQPYTPRLVTELDTRPVGSDSSLAYSPRYNDLQDHRSVAIPSGIVFAASTAEHGQELWFTDGTTASTQLLKDIMPGSQSSTPSRFVRLGDKAVFFAFSPASGVENWITDGTAQGTHLIRDVVPGPQNGTGSQRTVIGNTMLFVGGSANPAELWSTDGTNAGTHLVITVPTDQTSFVFGEMFTVGDKAYFTVARDTTKYDLWVSDGTPEGTVPLVEVKYQIKLFQSIWDVNGIAVMQLVTAAYGQEFWRSDGTPQGTYILKDFLPGAASGTFSTDAAVKNGRLWFSPITGTAFAFWSTDGTVEGTRQEFTFPGTSSQPLDDITRLGDGFIFTTTPTGFRRKLYYTDGTSAGTTLLAAVPGIDINIYESVQSGGRLYFVSREDINGIAQDIWSTDGTPAGTYRLVDNPSTVPFLQPLPGGSLMYGENFPDLGREPAATFGIPGDQRLIADINNLPGSSNPQPRAFVGDHLLATFNTPVSQSPLWSIDPLTGDATPLVDLPSTAGAPFAGGYLFQATDPIHGSEPYFTLGAPETTSLVTDLCPAADSGATAAPIPGATLAYYRRACPSSNGELVATTGDAAGTVFLTLTPSTTDDPYAGGGATIGDTLIFPAGDNTTGKELWISKGTQATTALLKTIRPGSSSGVGTSFRSNGSKVFFIGNDGVNGDCLWITDGTLPGTQFVYDFRPGTTASASITFRGLLGNSLILTADDDIHGTELWISDGTPAGTLLLADATSGPNSSTCRAFAATQDKAFFLLDTAAYGTEPWATDGTPAGTHLIRDIAPGINDSSPITGNMLAAADGKAFFSADDGISGLELWVTDGTDAGTALTADLWPGIPGSSPTPSYLSNVSVVGNAHLYYTAQTPDLGRELWSIRLCPADVDDSGSLDLDDFTTFVAHFEAGTDDADFDASGFVDTDDFTAFVLAFESGC